MSTEGVRRLQREYRLLHAEPPPFVTALPDPSDVFRWHFIVVGVPDSDYHGGEYFGTIIFPPNFPYKPPSIRMNTPSGRFKPDAPICFSFSDFHPETWQPSWTVSTILTALVSFMNSDEHTSGSVRSSSAEKRALASSSRSWNQQHPPFIRLFSRDPGLSALIRARQASNPSATNRPSSPSSSSSTTTTTSHSLLSSPRSSSTRNRDLIILVALSILFLALCCGYWIPLALSSP